MQHSTRMALKLAPGVGHAEAAAALAKGGHEVTHLGLQKTDSEFLLYLKREQPAVYSQLYLAQYGTPPNLPKPAPKPAGSLALGAAPKAPSQFTLRELEIKNPKEVLRLKREEPAEYARLFQEQYGQLPAGYSAGAPAPQAAAPTTPVSSGEVKLKQPIFLKMTPGSDAEVAEKLKEFDEAIRLSKEGK